TAKELAFAQAELGADVFEFGLKFREARASALMHGLPVTGLLAEFEVFGEQRAGVAAWQCGREWTLALRGRGREWTRVRRKVHPTSMIGTQLQGEVSRRRKTRLPKSHVTDWLDTYGGPTASPWPTPPSSSARRATSSSSAATFGLDTADGGPLQRA